MASNSFTQDLTISCSKLVQAIEEDLSIINDSCHERIKRPVRRQLGCFYSFDISRSLLTSKRPADNNVDYISPGAKRLRDDKCTTPNQKHFSQIPVTERSPRTSIVDAVDKLFGETEFIADGSKPYCLPTVRGKHIDLKSLTPNTGAIYMYRREEVQTLLFQPMTSCSSSKRNILIFHCEFSSERGPQLNRFLRNLDRELHKGDYPRLTYPEVYLLEGGYKTFYESHEVTSCS